MYRGAALWWLGPRKNLALLSHCKNVSLVEAFTDGVGYSEGQTSRLSIKSMFKSTIKTVSDTYLNKTIAFLHASLVGW